MSVTPFGLKIGTWVTAANGDTYGDADRFFLRTIQALVQPNVLQVGLNTPPGSPTNSQTYVVGTAPTGAWSAQANAVAYWAVDAQDGRHSYPPSQQVDGSSSPLRTVGRFTMPLPSDIGATVLRIWRGFPKDKFDLLSLSLAVLKLSTL